MRINTKLVLQMNDDGSFTELERESFEYNGPVARAFGGRSSTASTTTSQQVVDTTNIEASGGIGIASRGGDVEITQNVSDLGAIQGAFDFTQDFSEDAFNFAGDVARQAGETSERAIETSQRALATVATGGATDLAGINSKTIIAVVAGLAAIFLLPTLLKGSR